MTGPTRPGTTSGGTVGSSGTAGPSRPAEPGGTAEPGTTPRPGLGTPAAGPLSGLRVLVPRVTDGPDPLVIALSAAGAEPVVIPLIQTVPPQDPTELDDTLLAVHAGYYGWVGLTSAASVPVLADRAEKTGIPLPELLSGVRVAAVGGSTARALRSAGIDVDVVPTGPSSASTLLRVWPAVDGQPEPRRVLLPRGDLAADTLVDGLRDHGWAVDTVVAYRTVPGPAPEPSTRQDWADGGIDAVLLTSGSTARNLLHLLGPVPAGTRVIAVGAPTAAEARRIGLPVSAVATEQSPAGLVAALTAAVVPVGTPTPGPAPVPHPTTDGDVS